MSIKTLKSYLKKHGAAKTAVALNLKDTGPIKQYLRLNKIPDQRIELVRKLKSAKVMVINATNN